MRYYKDTTNHVHALESEAFEHLLPAGCVPITEAEAEALRPKLEPQDAIKAKITEIEATITPRRLREATLSTEGKAWLAVKDAEISALRAQL